jgi:flagellin-like protein
MLAALNMGIIGTIIVVAIVIALALFFLRRTA